MAGQPTALTYQQATGTTLAAYTATYDAGGQRVRVDELDGTYLYAYDPAGNRLTLVDGETTTEYAYNAADELLTTTPLGPEESLEVELSPLVSPPLMRDAIALTLPLAAGRRYEVEAADLELIGASGEWGESSWTVALESRTASLAPLATLATATFATSGAGAVTLTSGATIVADEALTLVVTLHEVGDARPIVGIGGAVRMTARTQGEATGYGYDANGNTVGIAAPGSVTTLTWDAENRLTSVASPDGTETYSYDSTTSVPGKVTGLRRSKTTGAGTTHFVWDQQNLLAELDGELERLSQYTGFPGGWGGLASARAGASSSFYGFDLSANTRAVFDALGAVDETALHSAFGPQVAGTLSGPFGFGGQVQYYTDARWLQVRARELEVVTGRWLSRDPLGPDGGIRLYAYADSIPVGVIDATGLGEKCTSKDTCPVLLNKIRNHEKVNERRRREWDEDIHDFRGERNPCNYDKRKVKSHWDHINRTDHEARECWLLAMTRCPKSKRPPEPTTKPAGPLPSAPFMAPAPQSPWPVLIPIVIGGALFWVLGIGLAPSTAGGSLILCACPA